MARSKAIKSSSKSTRKIVGAKRTKSSLKTQKTTKPLDKKRVKIVTKVASKASRKVQKHNDDEKEAKHDDDEMVVTPKPSRHMVKGRARREINREAKKSTGNVISTKGFDRICRSLMQHLGVTDIDTQAEKLVPGGKGKDGKPTPDILLVRKRTIPANPQYLNVFFGDRSLNACQQVVQRHLLKLLEEAFNSRVEEYNSVQREAVQNTEIRMSPEQLEGIFYRYFEKINPSVITMFRHLASVVGLECRTPHRRVV